MPKDPIARERITALSLRLTEQISAQKDANRIALDAAEKAVLKAEIASEKRFEGVNEFRATLSDQAANFVTTETVNARFEAVSAILSRLEKSDAANSGRGAGADGLGRWILAAVGLLIAAATFYRGLHP